MNKKKQKKTLKINSLTDEIFNQISTSTDINSKELLIHEKGEFAKYGVINDVISKNNPKKIFNHEKLTQDIQFEFDTTNKDKRKFDKIIISIPEYPQKRTIEFAVCENCNRTILKDLLPTHHFMCKKE